LREAQEGSKSQRVLHLLAGSGDSSEDPINLMRGMLADCGISAHVIAFRAAKSTTCLERNIVRALKNDLRYLERKQTLVPIGRSPDL
jgi:hypothetical protein